MTEQEQNKKDIPSSVPFVFKGWLIGITIGSVVGAGLGIFIQAVWRRVGYHRGWWPHEGVLTTGKSTTWGYRVV